MCLVLYIGSNQPLPLIPWNEEAPAFHVIDLPDDAQAARNHLAEPFVYYAGSYERCGCAFNFGHEYPDYEDEPEELLAAEQSRNDLINYLSRALPKTGSLRIFSCWANEETKAPEAFRTVTPAALGAKDFIFQTPELITIETGG